MSCVCHLNHWDLSKDRAKCCIVTELIYLPCSRRACACYRTPGLPAGGAGMCRVGVDAGGNLQSVQKPTPVARKGAGVSRKGEMCSFNQTCISLSLSRVCENITAQRRACCCINGGTGALPSLILSPNFPWCV